MLLMNRALFLGLFMMGTFVKNFDLLVKCESIPIQPNDPGPSYEDTREFYSVSSLKKANNNSSFIKLAFVVDWYIYLQMSSYNTVTRYCQRFVTLANSLFQPYNIFIALVDIIIQTENREIVIAQNNITVTHTRFKTYAQNFFKDNHSVDHVVLLVYKSSKMEKYYYLPPLEIVDKKCNLSTGVIPFIINVEWMAARLIFLFGEGLKINEDLRTCFGPMNDEWTYEDKLEWYLKNPAGYEKKNCIDKLMDKIAKTKTNFSCLKMKPNILFKTPICGNNFTEPGEECDCTWWDLSGDEKGICDECCDAATCRLKETNYSCAFGECCDLESCSKELKKYHICRPTSDPCDVAEYCDGEAAFCPKDKFVNESVECSIRECNIESADDGVIFCKGSTEYKGVCNSIGLCQYQKKISSKTYTIDTSTNVRSNPSISSEFYGSDSHWKTYFFIQSAVILLIVTIILSVYVHNTYMKKYRSRFHTKDQQRQTCNSSLRNGTINEPTAVNEDNQRLTEIAVGSFEMNSLSHQEHKYDELNTASNIYENPSEIHQQGKCTSTDNYSYTTTYSCPSTTSSGDMMPTATNSDNQQNIDDICSITIAKQQAPVYYKNGDKSNNVLDPIYEDCLYDGVNHPQNSASSVDENHQITTLRPISTTSSGYMIPNPLSFNIDKEIPMVPQK